MPLRAKRMKGLRIDEASGVDAPAHLAPGWMVRKAAGAGDPLDDLTDEQIDALIKAAEADEQGEPVPNKELIESLTKAMGSMAEPAKAQTAALIAQLGGDAGAASDDPVAKAVAEALTKATADTQAAEARATEAEAELAKAKGAAGETEEEALAKAMESLPEPIRKRMAADAERIAKAEADAADAVEKANTEREARVGAEYLTKAKGPEFGGLPAVSAETLGTILREVDEKLSKEAGAELTRLLKAASNLATTGAGDFRTYGGAGGDVSAGGGAMAQLEAKATELMASDTTLTKAEAITKAADINPELARAYEEAMR